MGYKYLQPKQPKISKHYEVYFKYKLGINIITLKTSKHYEVYFKYKLGINLNNLKQANIMKYISNTNWGYKYLQPKSPLK
jgi:hypothetical protein